jgi:hypothetical protein
MIRVRRFGGGAGTARADRQLVEPNDCVIGDPSPIHGAITS